MDSRRFKGKTKESQKFDFFVYDGSNLLEELKNVTYHDLADWLLRDNMKYCGYTFRKKNKLAFFDEVVADCELQDKSFLVQMEEVSKYILDCYEIKKKQCQMRASNRDLRTLHYIIQKKYLHLMKKQDVKPLQTHFKDGGYAFA